MSFLLKVLNQKKDAVVITLAARELITELWFSRTWPHPEVFIKSSQAVLAGLLLQALNEEDSNEPLELHWEWPTAPLKSLTVGSLEAGAVRTNFHWETDEVSLPKHLDLEGHCHLRRFSKTGQDSGVVSSHGNIVHDIQELLLRSLQKDCGIGISIRWSQELLITHAHAYMVDVLPSQDDETSQALLDSWNAFLGELGNSADWLLSEPSDQAAREMAKLLTANQMGTEVFAKAVRFFCNCTPAKIQSVLTLLTADDLAALPEKIEIICKHCAKIYLVDKPSSGLV